MGEPFHLYFAGEQCWEAEYRMEDLNSFRLLSYLNNQRHIKRRIELGLKTFIDSGAFSAFTLGKDIDIDKYIEWLNEHDDVVDIAAELDSIPGQMWKKPTKEEIKYSAEKSWENYLYMIERVKSPDKILPIFHDGEEWKYLERILNHKDKIPYIGISPGNDKPVPHKKAWIHKAFQIVKNSKNPNVKIHAFGMTSLKLLEQYPWYSADSTSWIMTGANGAVMSPWGTIVVSDNKKNHKHHVKNLSKPVREKLYAYVNQLGYDMEDLRVNYKARSCYNIDYLTEWAKNYQYKPAKVHQTMLF